MEAASGEVTGRWPWPRPQAVQEMSRMFRNYLHGASDRGERRLITAQGNKGPMALQAYDPQMNRVWERRIPDDNRGARGSHVFPAVDIDGDGREELFWGERCMDIHTGQDRWVGDEEAWNAHSDVIQPTLDLASGRWSIYTCREMRKPNGAVVVFDDRGRRVWGLFGIGHMDQGWTARLNDDGSHRGMAIEIGEKHRGPDGTFRVGVVVFLFDIRTGRRLDVSFPLFNSIPVDFNGDGLHELVYTAGEREGLVVDRRGRPLAQLGGVPFTGAKFLDRPGEQIVSRTRDGRVLIHADPAAADSPAALARYAHPYYASCTRALTVGYNWSLLGGL